MSYALAIFDFDGTLADSFPFFASVFNDLARRHGFRPIAPEETRRMRGMDARAAMRHVGMPAHKLPFVAKDFIARMRAGRDGIKPFPGAPELLVDLARAGMQVAIVSSNASDNVTAILGEHAARAVRFLSCGMSVFGKQAHLAKVLRQSGVAPERALYVGDQATDLEAARARGIDFGAVAWGYGDIEHLRSLGPRHTFGEMGEIARLLGVPR